MAQRKEGRKSGRKGGEQLAPGGERKWERVWQRPFSPLARPFALSAAFHACIAKGDLQKRSAHQLQQGAPYRAGPSLLAHYQGTAGSRAACLVQNFFASRLMLCRHGKQLSGRGRRRPRLVDSLGLAPQATPRTEPGHSYSFLPSFLPLPHTYSICFRFQDSFPRPPHPKCCHRQRHASFHPPLSRNFIGLAGSGWPRLLSHG